MRSRSGMFALRSPQAGISARDWPCYRRSRRSHMAANRKKLMLPDAMAEVGWDLARKREDIELLRFADTTPPDAFRAMLATADGIALWARPFPAADVDAAPLLQVVSRIGVGYDAVDVAALTKRRIPLLIGGTAN